MSETKWFFFSGKFWEIVSISIVYFKLIRWYTSHKRGAYFCGRNGNEMLRERKWNIRHWFAFVINKVEAFFAQSNFWSPFFIIQCYYLPFNFTEISLLVTKKNFNRKRTIVKLIQIPRARIKMSPTFSFQKNGQASSPQQHLKKTLHYTTLSIIIHKICEISGVKKISSHRPPKIRQGDTKRKN